MKTAAAVVVFAFRTFKTLLNRGFPNFGNRILYVFVNLYMQNPTRNTYAKTVPSFFTHT